METIKLRAWDKKQKLMRSQFYIDAFGNVGTYWEAPVPSYSGDLVIMQFIGVNDKNGKPIYEGDIIWYRLPKADGYTSWGHSIRFVVKRVNNGKTHNGWNVVTGKNKEVIGNIFENPNLLKRKKYEL